MKLKVKIVRFGSVVAVKILHQDESLRGIGEIASNKKYKICSRQIVGIFYDYLCIRGSKKSCDNNVAHYNFNNIEEAKNWIENIVELIEKINTPLTINIDDLDDDDIDVIITRD